MSTAIIALALTITAFGQADDEVERAWALSRARAAAGDAVAQFSLGSLLYYGTSHLDEALMWFRLAAAQGHAAAQCQLALMYDFGFGVARDDGEALAWYRRAADLGSAAAARAVGDFHKRGRGIGAPDVAEAARWYRRAAEGDDIRAQYELGQLHFTGSGVTRDYVAAYVWFSLAASQAPLSDNRKGLLELRNIAAARMTPAQLSEAERLVRQKISEL